MHRFPGRDCLFVTFIWLLLKTPTPYLGLNLIWVWKAVFGPPVALYAPINAVRTPNAKCESTAAATMCWMAGPLWEGCHERGRC